ncbi:MARTX multifunctional-autoprocessing repeats-in-toxin holotoxin RtxA [Photorhabdus temperata]|uniref:RtxA repeat/Peptidase C80 family n=1 Tax=Photorhabdus temperata subsp. temperata Meg1 TaxID=1393735 RepID=A0A081RSL6_PHOTE|nr:MARTX multifunctional-autoprocessing repeats-in-toxin holotoxin RtxA [Photorhabdus temperata]KER01669.1 RtxA repeat/Peptidase C80 family [Photorhabdus temperata subsp. temperata Meg1]
MGKSLNSSTQYFFTGNYFADDNNNDINAIGFGGYIYARGGDDHITLGSIAAKVYTGTGHDTVVGGAAYLEIEDTSGDLSVKGGAGYANIDKSGDGGIAFSGAAGAVSMAHSGDHGNLDFAGVAAYNSLERKGLTGDIGFGGAGGYNELWHETDRGNLSFAGAGAGNNIDRTWFKSYQGSQGDVTFSGAGAANRISSRVERGDITFNGAGVDNHIVRKGKEGNIILHGAGASNRIERLYQSEDKYPQTHGDITFEGVGGYNKIYSNIAHGNINFSGAGAYNEITRSDMNPNIIYRNEGISGALEYARAEEIVLTTATMGGDFLRELQPVTGIKSTTEPNTYLFAFTDNRYTHVSKVQLQNDPVTGKLNYYTTSWYKIGNHLENLASQNICSPNGFIDINVNGAYRLFNLTVEHQKPMTVQGVEENVLVNEWVTYIVGTSVNVENIILSDAKMGGHAVCSDSQKVDVSAVKWNRQPNTYVYAKYIESHTKVVLVELVADPETGSLQYLAKAWNKAGDHTGDLANEDFSPANGYSPIEADGCTLSKLQYQFDTVYRISEQLERTEEFDQLDINESSGDINFIGAGGGNIIESSVTRGNVNFEGRGAANVIIKSGEQGNLTFHGAGLANVIVHQSRSGAMDVNAGGAANVLVRIGDGLYLAHLLAVGNISIHKGNGDSRVVMQGGYNTHTQIGHSHANWLATGGFNVMTQKGNGNISSVLSGGANVLTRLGAGDLVSGMFGGANIITHISDDGDRSDTTAIALGGANVLTKKGQGNVSALMGGGANVLTHIGDGNTTGVMLGGANILTKVGNGDVLGIMFGLGNVLTQIGDGQILGVMGAAGNIFTKVGNGTAIAAMIGAGNLFIHVGNGDAWALMGGLGNIFTKVGDGNALVLMAAAGNVFTHIGDGASVALMLAKGNIATKVGNGMVLSAMVGKANIFTHVGDGNTFAAMIGGANVLTKVGNDLTTALMLGKANIYSHVGDGTSMGLFAGELNVMTKIGDGTTLAVMSGQANIMTHAGKGLTGVLAQGEANIVTKVGDDFMGVVAVGKANIMTHVGDSVTAGVLFSQGNILTKVGDGTMVGLLSSDIGNVMTHIGSGTTVGFAKGKANFMTKIGDGTSVNAVWGEANILTHVGDGDRYNFAKGKENIITKVGNGQEVTVVQGDANAITYVGDGDDYTGAWGETNVITKVGAGRHVVLAKGDANIVTQIGQGDSFNALWSDKNIVTKVGDGRQVIVAKGQTNITTTVGNGLNVAATWGDLNVNTKVGDGVSVNMAWGNGNINTKVGNGLNVAVMKGESNANIQVGDGLAFNAAYARNNVAIKIGNGDFYCLSVNNLADNKFSLLFDNIKQTALGVGGSQAINYLVHGSESNTSGTRKGRGAINLAEVSAISGFDMEQVEPVSSDLNHHLSASVTDIDTPDTDSIENILNRKIKSISNKNKNLIINGDFEQEHLGWRSTNGIEAYNPADNYGLDNDWHGERVSELDVVGNTTLYQDLQDLYQGEIIILSFDFAGRSDMSAGDGMEVFWNGERVFSTSGDQTEWQNQTLRLMAKEGCNRVEFKGTGESDGLGYVLDNVVAEAEMSLIVNGDFEQGDYGWQSTHGIEAYSPASAYGLDDSDHGERVSELDTHANTTIYQDLHDLYEGEVISLSFDFADRPNAYRTNNGIRVLWNGEEVFSTTKGIAKWQHETLELIAQKGSNRIMFEGTGLNDGVGYILDNVVAKSESSLQASAITEYVKQDKAAQNALSDKEKAETDRQLLEQEKDKQLAVMAGLQSQLALTDQNALGMNGQAPSDAVKEEAQAVTDELVSMTQGLDTLDSYANHDGASGDMWRNRFAGGLLNSVQNKLNQASSASQQQLDNAQQVIITNQQEVKKAVATSEAGAMKSEQHCIGSIQDTVNAQINAELKKTEALSQQWRAGKAKDDANSRYQSAERRGKRDIAGAENKAAQAKENAKGAQQRGHAKPERVGAYGSGLSGEGYKSKDNAEIGSRINPVAVVNADGRFSQGLGKENLQALGHAEQAVNYLPLNTGLQQYVLNTPDTVLTDHSASQHHNAAKGDILQKIDNKIFDVRAHGKELRDHSFYFSQSSNLLEKLGEIIPEIGSVRLTKGDIAESKKLMQGLCFALSARYLIEERVHGLGGGKAYMMWLKDAIKAYNDTSVNKSTDIGSIESALLNRYRRQNIGPAIEDILSMQYSQSMDSSTVAARRAANAAYGGKLKANGLTGPNINNALNYEAEGYESVMDKLRNVNKSAYMTFMSEDHAMSVVVHKNRAQTVWSFYDPNYGAKSFADYDDFRRFMDSFHKGYLTKYKFQASEQKDQSFYVQFNKFEEGRIAKYDGLWKKARDGEQGYVLRALKEQGRNFTLGSGATGRVVDYGEDHITLEVTTKQGCKALVEVEGNNVKHAVNFVQLNVGKVFTYPTVNKLTLKAPIPALESLSSNDVVENKNVGSWERITVTPQTDGRETRFNGQVIIQTENDPVVAKAAANLAGKHPDSSVVVQLDSDGQYRVVYGDPAKLSGKLRWQIVGHGRGESEQNNSRLSGYSADELAVKLKQFNQHFGQADKPSHISIVGCSLISDDKRDGFARRFITALDKQGIRSDVSARRSEVAVDATGRKFTRDENNQWVNNLPDNKIIFRWDEQGELTTSTERVVRGIAESDINLSRVGIVNTDEPAKGAIAKNSNIFTGPEKRRTGINSHSGDRSNRNQWRYSGNIQINVGKGEFTAINWGTSNVGIKVGDGGFKSLAFGDNNLMVHIGDGESKHSFDIGGYQALEGAQMFIGNHNVSFNMGRSNDLIVMMDKSIPTPPLINPFDGAVHIADVLQGITRSDEGQTWLVAQNEQWTLAGAKKFIQDMSGLDQTSSVDYHTLIELDSQNERSSRVLKNDIELTLNKKYHAWLSSNGSRADSGNMSRADQFRQANETLAFNFAVGGQGADMQVTMGNWNVMFGDNIQSILDTNLGSLFGLMTQQFTATGLVKTTFTYNPHDLPRQLKNRVLGRLSGVGADTTFADIFGVDYTAEGRIVSRTGEPVDGVAILQEMIEIIGEFSGEQLKVFADPEKWLDGLRSGINMGVDGVKSFAESHGLKEKEIEEESQGLPGNTEKVQINRPTTDNSNPERTLGFNALNLPNLFATIFKQDKQTEMKSLVTNLKENLTADLLNMGEKTFDFLHNSGHLQGDGDIHMSMGNSNFNWGGDGKDLGAYLGDNNNFWGGRGDDVFYSMGISNIYTGGEGNDLGILMGRENMMFGGAGDDIAVMAGRINRVFMGEGNDQAFIFGEEGFIDAGSGQDYVITSGNDNRVDTGEGQDYAVTIGNNNQVDLNEGDDFARVFGNDNRIDGSTGNDVIKQMGYHAVIDGGEGDDHLIAAAMSKFSQFDGGEGQDLLVLGGYQNSFQGGAGVDSFVVSTEVIDNYVSDINAEDMIVLEGINWQNLWFQRSGYDLVLSVNRHIQDNTAQGIFESIGSVTFNDYFNGNRAKLVTKMGNKDPSEEREFITLANNAVDSLIQAMSGFSPAAGDNGFIANLDSKAKAAITTAWADTMIGRKRFA